MNNYQEILVTLARRAALAILVFGLGWLLLATAEDGWGAVPQLLLGIALFVMAAIIIAPSLARLLAEPSGNLFYPSMRFDGPQPMYSIPESKRKSGFPQEAFDGFHAISQEHPQELKPYIEMIDIAIMDMKSGDLALSTFRHGLQTLTDEQAKDSLSRMYKAISSRLDVSPPKPRRAITLKKGHAEPSAPPLHSAGTPSEE
jgi:hypothetical protein